MVLVFAAEPGLSLGLIGTAGKFGRDWSTLPATVARTGTALFFLLAVGVLNEMRQRRPDAGCGCFDELSGTPSACAPSPELSEIMVRLGYSEPCELRRMPVRRTMSALHASSQWRRYAGQVSVGSPSDVWREGCWRFVVYPGYARGQPVDIVFAVYLQSRRPAVRAAVLDADTDEVLGPTGTRESAVL
jgi:hypothetical protein